jgi:hypothetical protein
MSWLSGALGGLEEALIEMEVKKRQKMLDDLAAKEQAERNKDRETGRKIQEAQLASADAQRQEAAQRVQQQRAEAIAKMLGIGTNLDADTVKVLREGDLGALIEQGIDTQMNVQAGVPEFLGGDQPTSTGPGMTVNEKFTFRGTADQIEKEKQRQAKEAYIKSLPPESPIRQFLEAQVATGDSSLPAAMFTPPKVDKPAVGSFEDFVVEKFGARPTPAQIAQARKEYNQADDRPRVTVQMGGLNPGQVNAAMKLADDYRTDSKDFISRSESFGTVRAASKDSSPAGDLSMIFAYMKMLDPGSVVREGEFATAQNTAGVPDRVRNAYNRVISGERLSPAQRADFLSQARNIYTTAKERQGRIRKTYADRASRFGIPAEHVVMDYGVAEEPADKSGGGFEVTDPNGKIHRFETQAQADAFKKRAGIK